MNNNANFASLGQNKFSLSATDETFDSLLNEQQVNADSVSCLHRTSELNKSEASFSLAQQNIFELIGQIKLFSQSRTYDEQIQNSLNKPKSASSHHPFGQIVSCNRPRKYGSNRKFVSKRIYLCGLCLIGFNLNQELFLHIQKDHNCQTPEGSIFGFKKETLFKFFHIPLIKPLVIPEKRICLFKCGCGKECTCSSSLFYHIRAAHDGFEPPGTIGIFRKVRYHQML